MKISQLDDKVFLNETNAMSQSDVVINYKEQGMTDAITYKTNLEILGKSIATHLNLLSYDNGAVQTYTTTGTTYGTTTVDIDGKADKVSSVTEGNFAGLDGYGNLVDSGHKHSDYLAANLKGANSGLAELDANGKIPIAQLPLGDTSSTVYRGDYGAAAYTHAVTNKGSAYVSGLYKITTNSEGHVTSAAAVEKSDITALGIPGSDTTYSSLTAAENGLDESLVTTAEKYNWNNKYNKPTGGIPANDIAEGVIPDISNLAPIDEPEFTTSITIGSTTLTEAQLQALLALLE